MAELKLPELFEPVVTLDPNVECQQRDQSRYENRTLSTQQRLRLSVIDESDDSQVAPLDPIIISHVFPDVPVRSQQFYSQKARYVAHELNQLGQIPRQPIQGRGQIYPYHYHLLELLSH